MIFITAAFLFSVIILIWIVNLYMQKREAAIEPPKLPIENKLLIDSILNNDIEGVVKSLNNYRAAPHSKSEAGKSAMELAISQNNKFIIAYLIKYGAFPNKIETKAAIESGNKEIMELVITGKHLAIIKEYEFKKL
ncbi:ankyrin repeat domain-containing protein [Cytobacillus firmus]|uniref:hypothetical protein n=1 Tax=Cytobacillus firmus TaxID=1399 RepID=UPI0038511B30